MTNKQSATMEQQEFYYSKGNYLIQRVEENYVTAEVFPNNQSKDSFEKAEFKTIAEVDTWVNNNVTGYDLNIPSDMTEQERKDYYNAVVKFAKSIQRKG